MRLNNIISSIKNSSAGKIILITAMIITVLSFFVQSALPSNISSAESDAVSDAIEPIIPSDTPVGEIVHPNIRKIGHFFEFGLFGFEVVLFLFLYTKRSLRNIVYSMAAALFIGLLDETVQIFSGRGPQISDVWLDFSGFATVFTLCYLMFFFASYVFKKIRKNK